MRKKRKLKKFLVIPVVLVLAAAAILLLRRGKKEGSSILPANITTEEAHIGTIRLTTEGNGSIEPADDVLITSDYTMRIGTVEVENGTLLAFGSANPRTEERFSDGCYTTYYGRAQAIVRAGESGAVTVHVRGEGLTEAAVTIPVAPNA